ncbi:MAG: hypothetical protein COT21_02930 [Hadesarchaea archaeon CG08_land_8_20_14_0_20_51_8]|nr:MAG: hypothetical protein COT21_02930 [Hadesarchaea archaeon CG08_land_8_20_14_0_20_51_8]
MDKEKLKEFIAFLKPATRVKSEELLEKDFVINVILSGLKNGEYALKGGTCLSKVYLDYHRISEDLDFTFIDQGIFGGKTTKRVKKICSEKITAFGKKLDEISTKHGFDFKPVKSDKKYVEIGSNNKLVTFKIWYRSVFTGADSFVKVQVTFVEILKFPITRRTVVPLADINSFSGTDKKYFEEFVGFYEPMKCLVYDVREIACEKVRALLTRKGTKTRDVADLYFIEKERRLKIEDLKAACAEKAIFAINSYKKYRENFEGRSGIMLKERDFPAGETEHLMLVKVDRKNFDAFLRRFLPFLEGVRKSALSKIA